MAVENFIQDNQYHPEKEIKFMKAGWKGQNVVKRKPNVRNTAPDVNNGSRKRTEILKRYYLNHVRPDMMIFSNTNI